MTINATLRQRIRDGHFSSKLEYVPPTRDPERRALRAAYIEDETRLERVVFRDAALAEVGLLDHPKAGRIFDYAWDKGHSNGLEEVLSELEELAPLFRD